MNKAITIYDYAQNGVEIVIPDFEKATHIRCKVISGDEVLTVSYNDKTTKKFDAYSGKRIHGYYDGCVDIPLNQIDEISEINNSYDMLEHFGDIDAHGRISKEAFLDVLELIIKGEIR